MLTTYCPLLTELFEHCDENNVVQVYAVEDLKNWGRTVKSQQFINIDKCYEFLNKHSKEHIYFNCNLMRPGANRGSSRGTNEDVNKVVMLYLDIDTSDGNHGKPCIDRKEAMKLLDSEKVIPHPTFLVNSGGGIHAYYLLEDPIDCLADGGRERASLLLEGINDKLRGYIVDRGKHYDRLKDLSRVLRVTGFENLKYDHRPTVDVELILDDDSENPLRYDPLDLYFTPDRLDPNKNNSKTIEDVQDQQEVIQEIATRDCKAVHRDWNPDGDGSSYVMKLCRLCVRHGCTEETATKVIGRMIDDFECPGDWNYGAIVKRYRDSVKRYGDSFGELFQSLEVPENDLVFAKLLRDRIVRSGNSLFIGEWNKWLHWNGKCFSEYNSAEPLLNTLEELVGDLVLAYKPPEGEEPAKVAKAQQQHRAACNSWLGVKTAPAVLSLVSKYVVSSKSGLDTRPDILPIDNGVLELKPDGSFEFREHSPEDMNTRCAAVAYDPIARCPRWRQFVDEVCIGEDGNTSPELVTYMQRVVGWCLTGYTTNQCLFLLYGGGSNGKSKFIDTVTEMLGDYAVSTSRDTVAGGRVNHATSLASLYNRRVVTTDEFEQGAWLKEAQVKMITSGNEIRCNRMREDEWSFQPTHKLLMSSNHLPQIRGTDEGIWRRIKIVPFRAEFEGERKDPDLMDKLRAELPGILNWALEGYRGAITEGLAEPSVVTALRSEHRYGMDPVRQFIEDECELGPDHTQASTELLAAFKLYLDKLGERSDAWNDKRLASELSRFDVTSGRNMHHRFKRGIRLKPEEGTAASDFDDIF